MIDTFRNRLQDAWARSDRIFDVVPRDRWLDQPIRLRHPILFYVGHLPAFAWNQVGRGLLDLGPQHETFDELFEFGIDPMGVDSHDTAVQWPTLDEVLDYRDRVRTRLLELVEDVAQRAPEDRLADRGRILTLVLEHEYMHHETLQYMFQQLDPASKRPPGDVPALVTGRAGDNPRIEVGGGDVVLGADFEAIDFGWDNEFPEHRQRVETFTIDRMPARIGDWIEFMAAGGYDRRELWTDDDWDWRTRTGTRHPAHWEPHGDGWRVRTMFDRIDLEEVTGWPVFVSLAEARAYCRWKGVRLPTEAELHRAMYGSGNGGTRSYPWGDAAPRAGVHGNFDFHYWAPTPVDAHPEGASAWGLLDAVGNGWEWTSSTFAPFPGFEAYVPTYPGYSADFFDDRHFVMLGASWATPSPLVRRSFRNWFQDHYPWMFAGFRTVAR
jgi:ergothioneine biosynthesis protein EgtB